MKACGWGGPVDKKPMGVSGSGFQAVRIQGCVCWGEIRLCLGSRSQCGLCGHCGHLAPASPGGSRAPFPPTELQGSAGGCHWGCLGFWLPERWVVAAERGKRKDPALPGGRCLWDPAPPVGCLSPDQQRCCLFIYLLTY